MNSRWIVLWTLAAVLVCAGCEKEKTNVKPGTNARGTETIGSDLVDDSGAGVDTGGLSVGDTNVVKERATDSGQGRSTDPDTGTGTGTRVDTATMVVCIDADSDNYCVPMDCDDADANVNPDAVEPAQANGVDEDCDGQDGYVVEPDSGADPVTCAEAAANRTYVGCDFWPTITYNMVWNNGADAGFHFAVVVANDGVGPVDVHIDGGALGAFIDDVVPAGGLKAIELPWVPALKGTTFNAANTQGNRVSSSVRSDGGAYHMTTSAPVTAWQFNPLAYKISPSPAGCIDSLSQSGICASVTNDAALLLPSTAMRGTYRAFTYGGSFPDQFGDAPGALAITAVADGTRLMVNLTGDVVAGVGVPAAVAGDQMSFVMNAGDVVQLLAAPGQWMGMAHDDLTGSLVAAVDDANPGTTAAPNFKPVQVIGVSPIADLTPSTLVSYADHMEETVLPAEALGHTYVVTPPSGPSGLPVTHRVRIVASVDGTTFTYGGTTPPGAPASLDAGAFAELVSNAPFSVTAQDGQHPFMVVSLIQDAEPAASLVVTPAQFRDNYSFLASTSYDQNYVDVLAPTGTTVDLDGAPLAVAGALAVPGWEIYRVNLAGLGRSDGYHRLVADQPVGLQVMGYGWATSYYYPGGLNLDVISAPPPFVIN